MTTPDPLTRAAAKLRDSVSELPEELRTGWERGDCHVVAVPRLVVVAEARCAAHPEGEPIAEHIALTASPDVTEATAALLLAAAIERQET